MSSKLTLSFAIALALSAVGSVARANPIPTSTDEARALAGQVTSQQQIDHTALANGPVTSTDDARAEIGRSLPASISPSLQALIARDTDEGRAATVASYQDSTEKESLAASPAGSEMDDRHN
ncbi:MAG: hypothetical protein AUH83_04330 [Deltaproteobacteria bacterium 13_1_40CM_4_68_19]|nr:MAG: hypothetical protein AUH83_04330 [Deltaproteobacteria bacterium 13_1_40CM_4_68_19]